MIFLLTDLFLILTNGIPMQTGGIGNDAYNIIMLRKNEKSKSALMLQLRSNALIQEGVRPKDMPAEWFVTEGELSQSARGLHTAHGGISAHRRNEMG